MKTQDGKYFNTVDYAEVAAGELTVDVDVQAEEAGAESSGIAAGEIDTLVDPIPYVASVESIEASTGGLDIEDDDGLTERVWLAPSKYSCAGPRDAYAYYARRASCRVMPNRAASASSASPVEVFKSSARPLASTYCITW